MAQSLQSVGLGEETFYRIRPAEGYSYFWGVAASVNLGVRIQSEFYAEPAITRDTTIRQQWSAAGTYFIVVTVFNANGCSNTRLFPVKVATGHGPEASNDYLSTNWLTKAKTNLLKNDTDPLNDLDSSSLKILKKADMGNVILLQHGEIEYIPSANKSGTDRFSYTIADFARQSDTAEVFVQVKDPQLFLPEGISPNGDGLNDYFVIRGLKDFPNSAFTVLRRDGIIVYHTNDYHDEWDGFQEDSKGQRSPLLPATYYYLFRPGGTDRQIKGFVHLVR